jgi:iron complex outermembrane receptor protein
MPYRQPITALCVFAGLCGAMSVAHAQEQKGAEAEVTLTEVIITAEKREQDLQRTSASVTALQPDSLRRAGVTDFVGLQKLMSDVSGRETTGSTVISIRGIQPYSVGPNDDSPNAVHVDGVYIARMTALNGFFYDLDRVEVLAGPQGTLYGRNAAGGTVNIITNKPSQTYGGYTNIEYGNYSTLRAEAAVNIPLSDTLAVRAAYSHYSHDGYYTDTGLNDADQNSGRISLLWKPDGKQQFLITGDMQQRGGKGDGFTVAPGGTLAGVIYPDDRWHNAYLFGSANLNKQADRNWGLMAQYDYDFDFATLTFQAAYRHNTLDHLAGATYGFLQNSTSPAFPIQASNFNVEAAHAEWNTQELRLTSVQTEPLQWIAGLYRFQERSTDNIALDWPTNASGTAYNPASISFILSNQFQRADSYAVFAQTTWTPEAARQWHLTLGARQTWDKKSAYGFNTSGPYLACFPAENHLIGLPIAGVGTCAGIAGSKSWQAFTYKINLAYDLTPSSMIYADVSTGYKAGGYAFGFHPEYDPERVTAYEIGSKNRFFGDRLQVNLSAWYYDYRDFEVTVSERATGYPYAVITVANADKARIMGANLSADWLATDHDKLHLAATWLDAVFVSYDQKDLPFTLYNTPVDLSGTWIPNQPKWTVNAAYTHSWAMWNGTFDAETMLHYYGAKLSSAALPGSLLYKVVPAYTTADLSLRYQPDQTRWSITGYIRNMFDEAGPQSIYVAQPITANPSATIDEYVWADPRTFGIIVSAEF